MMPNVAKIDAEVCRRRTRGTMAASAVVHALLLTWLITHRSDAESMGPVTEIVLLEPGDAAPAASAPAASGGARESSPGVAASSRDEARFRREAPRAEIAPEPQSDAALSDRINERLAALRGRSESERTIAVPVVAPFAPAVPVGFAGVPAGTGGSHVSMRREGTGAGAPMTLARGSGGGTSAFAPALAAHDLPPEKSTARAPATGGETTARRQLAGASLAGPIADRAIRSYVSPVYPEWAKREAVEGTVRLYFVVRADGSIKENVLVQKTAGFEDFDDSARQALLAWRFAPLGEGRTGEQWGTITFHFRIRDAE
jgi:TonB family protein